VRPSAPLYQRHCTSRTDQKRSKMLPHLWVSDPREPLFTFSLPSVVEGTYGVYMFSIMYWVETLSVRNVIMWPRLVYASIGLDWIGLDSAF
jgi:hypothetical protein